jgi:hypothetical protein
MDLIIVVREHRDATQAWLASPVLVSRLPAPSRRGYKSSVSRNTALPQAELHKLQAELRRVAARPGHHLDFEDHLYLDLCGLLKAREREVFGRSTRDYSQ